MSREYKGESCLHEKGSGDVKVLSRLGMKSGLVTGRQYHHWPMIIIIAAYNRLPPTVAGNVSAVHGQSDVRWAEQALRVQLCLSDTWQMQKSENACQLFRGLNNTLFGWEGQIVSRVRKNMGHCNPDWKVLQLRFELTSVIHQLFPLMAPSQPHDISPLQWCTRSLASTDIRPRSLPSLGQRRSTHLST